MTEQQDQMIADAVKNLRIKWVLRQKVRTVEKAWLVDLFETENERIARQDYDRLVRDNPEAYFELVAVLHSECCMPGLHFPSECHTSDDYDIHHELCISHALERGTLG